MPSRAPEPMKSLLLWLLPPVMLVLPWTYKKAVSCNAQLGLFGCDKQHKIVHATQDILPSVQKALVAKAVDGRITCLDVWRIADQLGVARLDIANACESLNIQIIECQLGAF